MDVPPSRQQHLHPVRDSLDRDSLDLEVRTRDLTPDDALFELSQEEGSYYRESKKAAWREAFRRLKEDPRSIPDQQFWRIWSETTRIDILLRREKQEREPPVEEGPSILDVINNPALPKGRREQILGAAITDLKAKLTLLEGLDAIEEEPQIQEEG